MSQKHGDEVQILELNELQDDKIDERIDISNFKVQKIEWVNIISRLAPRGWVVPEVSFFSLNLFL